jgi:adenylate cyclase
MTNYSGLASAAGSPGISRKPVPALMRSDALRDEFNRKIDENRHRMLEQVRADAQGNDAGPEHRHRHSRDPDGAASVVGLLVSFFVSTGITRPVRRLLDGTRAVEAGRLDASIDVTTRDEIGQLTTAFNNMVEQLRHKERLRETSAAMSTRASSKA